MWMDSTIRRANTEQKASEDVRAPAGDEPVDSLLPTAAAFA